MSLTVLMSQDDARDRLVASLPSSEFLSVCISVITHYEALAKQPKKEKKKIDLSKGEALATSCE